MEKQDAQDQDLRYQQLLQHYQQLLQHYQLLLQHNQQHYQQLLQHNQQQYQQLLQHNQQLPQHNQQSLAQYLLHLNEHREQLYGQVHSMPFHQVLYPVYSQGSYVCYRPGPVHDNARPIMATALGTSNAGESCTSREENRSISDGQKVDYERRQNNEALNKSMDARYLQDQTAELNRLSLQFQEMELELRSRIQEILQERQNNLQNPASDSSQDPVPNSIGQEGPSSNTSRRICEVQTPSGDQQVTERDPERDSVRDPETPE